MIPFDKDLHIQAIQELHNKEEYLNIKKSSLKAEYIDANTIDVDLDASLYRIMPLERLLDILDNKRLGMVHPQCWDDPYEVFLMRSYGVSHMGNVGFEAIINSLYGMCFTLKTECDGMWRSFSAGSCEKCSFCKWWCKHGKHPVTIKIKTTGRKLMDAFYDINDKFHSLSYWIGKVSYCDSIQIQQMVINAQNYIMDTTGVGLVQTLLVKRKPFEYEQEVRLLYNLPSIDPVSQLHTPNVHEFAIDPNSLIEEIELSPWVPEQDVIKLTEMIKSKYNGVVTHSKLYDEPDIHIRIS